MAKWQNGKWQNEKMEKMTKLPNGQIAKLGQIGPSGKMAQWQNGKIAKWKNEKIEKRKKWQNCKMAK